MSREKIVYTDMTLGERLRIVRKHMGLTQEKFASILTINGSYISDIEKGKAKPSEAVIKDITTSYRINRNFLVNGEKPIFLLPNKKESGRDSRLAKLVYVPILGRVPAGFPQSVEENIESYLTLPGVTPDCFALRVIGESMEPGIKHGDYVLFAIDREARPGDIVVVNDEFGESMIKRLKEKNGKYYLVSDNPAYPTVEPNGDYRIMGVVVDGWRSLKLR